MLGNVLGDRKGFGVSPLRQGLIMTRQRRGEGIWPSTYAGRDGEMLVVLATQAVWEW